jgi:hypothetical protein
MTTMMTTITITMMMGMVIVGAGVWARAGLAEGAGAWADLATTATTAATMMVGT